MDRYAGMTSDLRMGSGGLVSLEVLRLMSPTSDHHLESPLIYTFLKMLYLSSLSLFIRGLINTAQADLCNSRESGCYWPGRETHLGSEA